MIITFIMFLLNHEYSRSIILGTIIMATFLELITSNFYLLSIKITPRIEEDTLGSNSYAIEDQTKKVKEIRPDPELVNKIKQFVKGESLDFILNNIANNDLLDTLFVATTTRFNIDNQSGDFQNIVNLKRINDIQRINKFFESANKKLPMGGIFIDSVETYVLRKKRIMKKYPWGLNVFIYSLDFIIKRVFPKLTLTKGIYFFLTRGNNRVISKAETLGRLYSCGFEIIEEALIDNHLFFAARKIKDPVYDLDPTYGLFIKLRRIGKGGRLFNVYKLRTMHPYAEYLQQYIYNKNHLAEGGKFKNDFRITTLGRIFRKFWLDELPMFINLFKGNMKLVGVRPISKHYYELYCDELKEKRIQCKPGLFPPYYADLPKTMDEIMQSELNYLEKYKKHPLKTDFIYFWKALYNILIKRARSQ